MWYQFVLQLTLQTSLILVILKMILAQALAFAIGWFIKFLQESNFGCLLNAILRGFPRMQDNLADFDFHAHRTMYGPTPK